jgi:hypothetical protein
MEKITRREFIRKTSLTAISTNIIASNVLANTPEKEKSVAKTYEENKSMNKPMELVSYCGGYCGKCGICGANIQTSLTAIQNVMQTAGIRQEAEHLGWDLMRDIATQCCKNFETEVTSFADLATKLFPTNCRGGCVPCDIAKCCKEKGFFTCAECSDMETCDKLGKHYAVVSKNLQEIRKVGAESWAKKQYEEVMETKRQKFIQAINETFEQAK